MAELTYDDVRRAATDAVKELRYIINGLKNSSDDIWRGVQQTSGSPGQLNDLMNRLDSLQNQMNNIDSTVRNQTSSINLLNTIQQNVVELHQRLKTAEQLLHFVYNCFMTEQQTRKRREQGQL
jgi:archaellum component FlaC